MIPELVIVVIWTPNFCFPVIVEFDDNFLDQIKILKMFFRKHIAHELVTQNLENDHANTVKASVVDAPIYCYCKKEHTENDKMIGCDNETSNVNLKVHGTVKSA